MQDSRFARWKQHHATLRGRLHIPDDYRPWTSTHDVGSVPVHLKRAREMLDLSWARILKDAQRKATRKRCPIPYDPVQLQRKLWCDLSQAAQRASMGSLPTLHRNCWLYSVQEEIALPGDAHPLLHGFPSHLVWESSAVARSLAGESYCLPSAGQALVAALLTPAAPWWSRSIT